MSDALDRSRRLARITLAAAVAAAMLTGGNLPAAPERAGPLPPVGASTTSPTTAPASPELAKRIADAVAELGSVDFPTRERATRVLWDIGDPALPALRKAAETGDAETVTRAKLIVNGLASGVRPDTPPAVIQLLTEFRRAEPQQRRELAVQLGAALAPGVRVLMRLSETDPDPGVRETIVAVLASRARPAAAKFIADGETGLAARLLEKVAGESLEAARDHAAYLLLTGGLDAAVARLDTPPDAPAPPPIKLRVAALYRARGDASRAADAAFAAGEPLTGEVYLADAGRWADLAKRVDDRAVVETSAEELGFATAYHRLAGDKAGADRYAGKLEKLTGRPGAQLFPRGGGGDDRWDAAEALMLNGYASKAIEVLVADAMYAAAVDFLAARLEFDRLDKIVSKAKRERPDDLPRVLAEAAGAMQFTGRREEAADLSTAIGRGAYGRADERTWQTLIRTGPSAGVPQGTIDDWLARLLEANGGGANGPRMPAGFPDAVERWFRSARFGDPDLAARWYRAMQAQPSEGPAVLSPVARLRKIDRRELTKAELDAMLAKLTKPDEAQEPEARVEAVLLAADTLVAYDRPADAADVVARLPAGDLTPETAVRVGDVLAKAERWDRAAAAYADAQRLGDRHGPADPPTTNNLAVPVALRGHALMKAGRVDEGRRLMELAHLMPLGDEKARHALVEALDRHKLKDDVRREHELINVTGDANEWAYTDSLRRLAAIRFREGDPALAATLWERAFLSNLSKEIGFVEPSANLAIPALIRRSQAAGYAKAGKAADAVAAAAELLEMHPGDCDSQIAIVRALDKAKSKAEADAVHKRAAEHYEAILKKYPESGAANNLVAWLSGCCKRDLDHALECAKAAVKAEPNNAAILDTLSEVHFARGEWDLALDVNAQCRKLEPMVEHHKKNLARFEAAKAGKAVNDGPLEGEED